MGASASSYKQPAAVPSRHFAAFSASLPSLAGKAVAITGCTSGTGLAAAQACARLGAHVLLLNRASPRAEAARVAVAACAAPGAAVTAVDCDLQSFASVRGAAAAVRAALGDGGGLDVLLNNAGVMALPDVPTPDGHDVQMQTNHTSHFLLSRELMPQLERAAALRGDARIVNHSSGARLFPSKKLEARYFGKGGAGALGGDGASMFFGGARWVRYHMTKLANAVFTVALNERLVARGSRVRAFVAAPGLAATNLQVTTAQAGGMAETWIMRWAQSAEDGSMGILACTTAKIADAGSVIYEPAGIGGLPVRKPLESICTDPAARKLLWEESERAVGKWDL
jgi:NAD(P)-dependent dehydrogenase (short-subunit alcohol dehydrogenase family)